MPEIKNHPPGSFCWAEVGTIHASRTKAFYSELFGWKYDDRPAGPFGVYTMCTLDEKPIAGLYELPPELVKAGLGAHWMSYIAVANADSASRTIQQHGGTIQQGPFDVMDVGRMAICQDPTGAVFSIWQPKAHKGAGVLGEPGTPCWFELATRGVEKAEAFYREVFGWNVKADKGEGFVYRELSAAGASCPQGGMMEILPEYGPVPPHWKIYFTVEDCETDAQRAQTLGGKLVVPPMEIPKVGRFAVLADPAGAQFAIIQLTLAPSPKDTAAAKSTASPKSAPSKPDKPTKQGKKK